MFILSEGKLKQINHTICCILYLILMQIIIISKLINASNLNDNSKINLLIKGDGNQNLLNDNFFFEPSEVWINNVKDDSCKKFVI